MKYSLILIVIDLLCAALVMTGIYIGCCKIPQGGISVSAAAESGSSKAGILDWFNPYMNFTGHIHPVEIIQTAALVFLILTVKP